MRGIVYMVWWQQQTYARKSPWSHWEIVLLWSPAIRVMLSTEKDCQQSQHPDNNKAMLSLVVVNKDCRQIESFNRMIAKMRIFSWFSPPPRSRIVDVLHFKTCWRPGAGQKYFKIKSKHRFYKLWIKKLLIIFYWETLTAIVVTDN